MDDELAWSPFRPLHRPPPGRRPFYKLEETWCALDDGRLGASSADAVLSIGMFRKGTGYVVRTDSNRQRWIAHCTHDQALLYLARILADPAVDWRPAASFLDDEIGAVETLRFFATVERHRQATPPAKGNRSPGNRSGRTRGSC